MLLVFNQILKKKSWLKRWLLFLNFTDLYFFSKFCSDKEEWKTNIAGEGLMRTIHVTLGVRYLKNLSIIKFFFSMSCIMFACFLSESAEATQWDHHVHASSCQCLLLQTYCGWHQCYFIQYPFTKIFWVWVYSDGGGAWVCITL